MSEPAASVHLTEEIHRLEKLTREWVALFPQAAGQTGHWLHVLEQVRAHLAEAIVRVAVVGAVKSGKSTLINALAGRDLLKRGAGILTAMVTRVRPGAGERAVLQFKNLDAIGGEIQQALNLLADARLEEHPAAFDLSLAADRELLRQILAEGEMTSLWASGTLNPNFALLSAYLAGYDRVREVLAAGRLELTGPELSRHQELVTREELAVYLQDATLTIPIPDLPLWVELGDCQGSDSPLPQHLTQVLAYLLTCDLGIYVISSRVGLRRADFQFLQELNRMGLGEHLLFVLNLDLTEHQSEADCQALAARVRRELAGLLPHPRMASFSALKLLLEGRRAAGDLEPGEEGLLTLWAADPAKVALSDAGWREFRASLQESLEAVKTRRLAGGSLTQVHMVARGLAEQVQLARTVLGQDAGAFRELAGKLEARRQTLAAACISFQQALEGAAHHIKGTLKKRVAAFLDQQGGKDAFLVSFVANFQPDWEALLAGGPAEPLRLKLYRLFQEFQQELLRLAGGEFNLQVVEFVRRQEDWLKQELRQTCAPLFLALGEALTLYYRETADLGLAGVPPNLRCDLPERSARLEVPLLKLELEPGWRWAGEVWLHTGMGFLERAWEKVKARLGFKGVTDPRQQEEREIRRALSAIRKWVQEELRVQLLDFGEGLKFRYLFPLVDEFRQGLVESLDSQLKSLLTDLESLAAALSQGEADREERRRLLEDLALHVHQVEARLAALAAAEAGSQPQPPAGT